MSSKIVASAIVLSFCAAPVTQAQIQQMECPNKTMEETRSSYGPQIRLVYRRDPSVQGEWIAWSTHPAQKNTFILQAYSLKGRFGDRCTEMYIISLKISGELARYEAVSGFFTGCEEDYGTRLQVGKNEERTIVNAFGRFRVGKDSVDVGAELKPFWQEQLDNMRAESAQIDKLCAEEKA